MKAKQWRKLRKIVQVLFLFLFLYLSISATYLSRNARWADLFFRFDPLVAITASLAGRTLVAGLGLSAITLLATLLLGRVWCGWFCPLGTVLDWITPRKKSGAKPPEQWRSIKILLVGALLFAALLGNQTLLFLDPLSIMSRTLAVAIWPALRFSIQSAESFLYQFRFLWGLLDWIHGQVIFPIFEDTESVFSLSLPIFLLFTLLVGLNWWARRFWCRYLCPLGGLLGLISRLALFRRQVKDSCTGCGQCTPHCPTGTIDPQRNFASDPAECTVCYDCIPPCGNQGVDFIWHLPLVKTTSTSIWKPAEKRGYDPSRRQLLVSMGAVSVGIALSGVEPITQRSPAHLVRPPGATQSDMNALCIRCNECVRVCPTQGLEPALFETGWQNMLTPLLVPRLGYCSYPCNACGEVCPTGAIPPLTIEEKQQTRIGLARVDRNRCLPWAYSVPCIVCEESCPLGEKAIELEEIEIENGRGNRITIQRPLVLLERCIGCGICEFQCPMEGEAAIRVHAPTDIGLFLPG